MYARKLQETISQFFSPFDNESGRARSAADLRVSWVRASSSGGYYPLRECCSRSIMKDYSRRDVQISPDEIEHSRGMHRRPTCNMKVELKSVAIRFLRATRCRGVSTPGVSSVNKSSCRICFAIDPTWLSLYVWICVLRIANLRSSRAISRESALKKR